MPSEPANDKGSMRIERIHSRYFPSKSKSLPLGMRGYVIPASPFVYRKRLLYGAKEGFTGVVEDTMDRTRCYEDGEQVSCGASQSAGKKPKQSRKPSRPSKKKVRAEQRGELVAAIRTGKKGKIVMADGSPVPDHIDTKKIPPGWTDIKIGTDPNSEVYVTGRDSKGRRKSIYSASFKMRTTMIKFARVHELMNKQDAVFQEIQQGRNDPDTKEMADCLWLIQEQGTRPGSDADTKGTAHLYGNPVAADDVIIKQNDKGKDDVFLRVKDKFVRIKNPKAKAELARRKEEGGDLHDSTYWLKSFGATTLEARHVVDKSDGVYLEFMGKESVWHSHKIQDPDLAAMLLRRKQSREQPTDRLFDTDDDNLRDYTATLGGGGFSPKDFRTRLATARAIELINERDKPRNMKEYKKAVKEIATKVSSILGNDPEQAINAYISPVVWETLKPEDDHAEST